MNFNDALKEMKLGNKVKLPNWGGYWIWDNESGTVMMHTKDGDVIDIFESDRKSYTLENLASDEFVIAKEENTPVLGGNARMSFGDALKLVKRGMGMRLSSWGQDVVIRCCNPVDDVEAIAEEVHNSWWEEKKKQGVTNHPDMIPYSDLTEQVKEYDRVTALATMRAINAMTAPYLYVESRYGKVPWKETMIELFSEDWEVVA